MVKELKECKQCNFKTRLNFALKIHLKKIHGKERKKIDSNKDHGETNKTTNRIKLQKHFKSKSSHDRNKDQQCPKCEYATCHASCLQRHIKAVHDKIKDIKCHKCEYRTAQKQSLNKHIKVVHDKVNDLKCDKCNYATSYNNNLTQHVKAVHGQNQGL